MGNKASMVKVKVYIDRKNQKVMFAEAQEDFVEILFSFLTLPLGTIARHSCMYAPYSYLQVGSLYSLYYSVENLDVNHFFKEESKLAMLYPKKPDIISDNMKVDLASFSDASLNARASNGDSMLLKKKGSFLITDDLKVAPLSLDKTILLLNSIDVEDIQSLEVKTVYFDFERFSHLLKCSLLMNNPLTYMVIGGSKPQPYSCIRNSIFGTSSLLFSKSASLRKVKFLVRKSTHKVLCAQADNFFVEMLLSFLTIPLGAAKRLTLDNNDFSVGIDNVYNSISSLGDENYFKSEDYKKMLLDPKVASCYRKVTGHLNPASLLKKQVSFLVSDDLKIGLLKSISSISKFTFGIPVSDIEVVEVSIGEQEGLLILKASLTSKSPLTDCLKEFRKANSISSS